MGTTLEVVVRRKGDGCSVPAERIEEELAVTSVANVASQIT
jgi:hypothetical protein